MFLKLALALSILVQNPDDMARHLGVNEPYEAFKIFKCETSTKPVVRFVAWEAELRNTNNRTTVFLQNSKKQLVAVAMLQKCKQIGVTVVPIRRFDSKYDKTKFIRRIDAR